MIGTIFAQMQPCDYHFFWEDIHFSFFMIVDPVFPLQSHLLVPDMNNKLKKSQTFLIKNALIFNSICQ